MWQQNYEPVGGSLIASALVAAIPIAVLFFMLGVRRKPSWMAAITALAVAFVLALRVRRLASHGHHSRRPSSPPEFYRGGGLSPPVSGV